MDGTYLNGTVLGATGAVADDSDTAAKVESGGVSAPQGLDFANTNPFSLEAWAKFTAVGSYQHLFNKDVEIAGAREQFGVYINGGSLAFERHVGGVRLEIVTPVPTANEYHHIVSTYDGSTMKLYVDGELRGSASDSRPQQSKPVPLFIGAKGPDFQRWPGVVDEVAIYPLALSLAAISNHCLRGRGR